MGIRLMVVMVVMVVMDLSLETAVMDIRQMTAPMMDRIPAPAPTTTDLHPTTALPPTTAATAPATPPATPHHSQLPRATTKPTRIGTGSTTTRIPTTGRDPTGRLGHGLVPTKVRVPDTLCGIQAGRRRVRCRRRRVPCIRIGIPRVRVRVVLRVGLRVKVGAGLIMEVGML
jgi:hypothetical protein